MCDPIIGLTIASTALSIGSQVLQHKGQNQAYNANVEAANLNFANQSNIIQMKGRQLDQEASERTFDSAIARQQAEGRIAASVGDRGLGGPSIIQSLNANMFGIGRQDAVAGANDLNARVQLGTELTGADLARKSQINQVAKPSKLGLVLGIAKAGVDGANTYKSLGGRF